jgi:anti-anti-sigma regulatory factor
MTLGDDVTTRRPRPRRPHDTELSETVNPRTGRITASGHLTRQGADLLRGTADSLRDNGHSAVVLDLQGVRAADEAGLDILHGLRRSFAETGDRLFIENAPGGD